MSVFVEFMKELDTLIELVQSVTKEIGHCNDRRTEPEKQLELDRTGLGESVSQAKTAVTEVTNLAVQAHIDVSKLQTELLQLAKDLATEGNQKLTDLEKATSEVSGLVTTLTTTVGDASSSSNDCTNGLNGAYAKLSNDSDSDVSNLGTSFKLPQKALEVSEEVARSAYNSNLFNDLTKALKALQDSLQDATVHQLPSAITGVSNTLTGEHSPGVQTVLNTFADSTKQSQADYLDKVQENASFMRQEERTELTLTDKLANEQLPARSKAATANVAEPRLRGMTEEAAKTFAVSSNMMAYLRKAMASSNPPNLETVRNLHLALQGMLR